MSPDWKTGVILISMAFGLKPDDYRDWELNQWKYLVKQAEEFLKQNAKKGMM